MNAQARLLVVDDEPGMRAALAATLRAQSWSVDTAAGVAEARERLRSSHYQLVVTDMRMPDGTGLDLLESVRQHGCQVPVVFITAYGTVGDAVAAMKRGACDYLVKPVAAEQLRRTIARLLPAPPADEELANEAEEMVGRSPAFRWAIELARRAAASDEDVVIQAESGCGKELLARLVHRHSRRCHRPFVALNCAAVPEPLLESELFGHARGAFTGAVATQRGKFEMANGGTILLDEIGEMPLTLQPKLLRVLQERQIERLGEERAISLDLRVIATTNRDLRAMVRAGTFRADLFYRLYVIHLELPPLRARREDIPLLAEHFVRRASTDSGIAPPRLSEELLEKLQAHGWPGNVRELANAVRRMLALHRGPELDASCFDPEGLCNASSVPTACEPNAGTRLHDAERELFLKTLELARGNRTHAAEMLGVSLRTVRNKVRAYGLPPKESYA